MLGDEFQLANIPKPIIISAPNALDVGRDRGYRRWQRSLPVTVPGIGVTNRNGHACFGHSGTEVVHGDYKAVC